MMTEDEWISEDGKRTEVKEQWRRREEEEEDEVYVQTIYLVCS